MTATGALPPDHRERIGRYQIRAELGRGTMGVVYEAFDPTLDRSVALKTVEITFPISAREREAFEQRFFAEARSAAALQHPNVVVIHDLGRDEASGALYMALEHVRGRSLAELSAGDTPLEWREAVRIAALIADALQAAHEHGIVHRDIKPANVMLLPSGQPKILDFGIARLRTSELTGAGQVFGTPAYMSPEQTRGEPVDARSDVFSLGTVLYQLLTGHRPFESDSVTRTLMLVSERDPEPPSRLRPGIPAAVDAVVGRAMEKQLARRYASARQLCDDLEDLLAGREPGHLSGRGRAAARGAPEPRRTAPAAPTPTLDLDSELHALVSEPTHEISALQAPAATRGGERLRLAAGVLALAALLALGWWAWRRPPTPTASPGPERGAVASTAPEAVFGSDPVLLPSPPPPLRAAVVLVDFEHHLKSGNLRVWIDGEVALDRWLSADNERNIVGIRFRHGALHDSLEVQPGTHDVRVRLAWDDNLRSETVSAHFVEAETRVLRVRLDRLSRKLSLDWR